MADIEALLANVPDEHKAEARAKYEAHLEEKATAADVESANFDVIYEANLAALREENAVRFNQNLAEFLNKLAMVFPDHADEIDTRMDMLKGLVITSGDEILVQQFATHSASVKELLDEHNGGGDWIDKVSRMLQSHGDSCHTALGVDLRELWDRLDDNGKKAVAAYIQTAWSFCTLYHGAETVVNEMRTEFEQARLAAERIIEQSERDGVHITRRELQEKIDAAVKASMGSSTTTTSDSSEDA